MWEQASEIVVSRLAWTEALAALAAALRGRRLTDQGYAAAVAVMEADFITVTWEKRLRQAALQAGMVASPADS